MLELQEYLEEVLFTAHRKEISAYDAALEHFPDYLLHKSDEYMASLINKVTDEDPSISKFSNLWLLKSLEWPIINWENLGI